MSVLPTDLKYSDTHEWVRVDGDHIVVGITDHAQDLLGDVVFVDLPEVGTEFSAKDACLVVESVKAASDVYAPASGEIISVNEALEDSPELVNESPYDDGWLFTIKLTDDSELERLLTAEQYEGSLDS